MARSRTPRTLSTGRPRPRREQLGVADIERGYDDDRWLGWGYLNGRRDLSDSDRAYADLRVLGYANRAGWDYERLFAWCNSRPGRHFADAPFSPGAASCLTVKLEV